MDKPCLEWTGSKTRDGYGRTSHKLVHRIAWEDVYGPIPDGMCVLHNCDNPPCYEIEHLRLGTREENNAERDAKGRHRALKGELNGFHKLTESDILDIRKLKTQGLRDIDIANRFDVSRSTISLIIRGKRWSHV